MTREEQLAAAERLAADGVLTAAELARIRRRLGEPETAELRYILTWVEVPNSRGTVYRRELALVLDGHDRPKFAMERAAGLLGKEPNRWLRLRPVR